MILGISGACLADGGRRACRSERVSRKGRTVVSWGEPDRRVYLVVESEARELQRQDAAVGVRQVRERVRV